MALKTNQKKLLAQALDEGKTEMEAAEAAGCSRSAVQSFKRRRLKEKESIKEQAVKVLAQVVEPDEDAERLFDLTPMQEREPLLEENLWQMSKGMCEAVLKALGNLKKEDIPPRQIPAMAKAAKEITTAYLDLYERTSGFEALAEVVAMNQGARND